MTESLPAHGNCRYHGNGEVIRREEFAQRKQAAEELQLARLNTKAKRLASAGKKFDGYPILQVSEATTLNVLCSCANLCLGLHSRTPSYVTQLHLTSQHQQISCCKAQMKLCCSIGNEPVLVLFKSLNPALLLLHAACITLYRLGTAEH